MYAVRAQSDFTRKRLHTSTAIELLNLYFTTHFATPTLLPAYLSFLKQSREEERGINNDEWNMTFAFFQQFPTPDLSQFDSRGSWPMLLCDFVSQLSL